MGCGPVAASRRSGLRRRASSVGVAGCDRADDPEPAERLSTPADQVAGSGRADIRMQTQQPDDGGLGLRVVFGRLIRRTNQASGGDARCVHPSSEHVPSISRMKARPPVMPAPKFGPTGTEDQERAAGHVLGAVRADPLHHGISARVPDREPHARPTDDVQAAGRGAVQAGVAGEGRPGDVCEVRVGNHDDGPARQPLGHIVVGGAREVNFDAAAEECAERLAGDALEPDPDRRRDRASLDGPGQRRPERTLRGRHREAVQAEPAVALERGDDACLERRRGESFDDGAGTLRGRASFDCRRSSAAPPMRRSRAGIAAADRPQDRGTLADHLAHRARPDGREFTPEILGERRHEPLDLLGRAGELGPEVVALGRDPGRARVEVALAGHVAADGDERGRPERELLRPEKGRHQEVAAALEASIGAERDAVAEPVPEQELVDLGEAEFPRHRDMLDRAQGRCARFRRRRRRGGCSRRRPW